MSEKKTREEFLDGYEVSPDTLRDSAPYNFGHQVEASVGRPAAASGVLSAEESARDLQMIQERAAYWEAAFDHMLEAEGATGIRNWIVAYRTNQDMADHYAAMAASDSVPPLATGSTEESENNDSVHQVASSMSLPDADIDAERARNTTYVQWAGASNPAARAVECMALRAGFVNMEGRLGIEIRSWHEDCDDELRKFAASIRAQAMEDCAVICEASAFDAIVRALDEAGIRSEVLRGMCLEVGMEKFRESLAAAIRAAAHISAPRAAKEQ